MRIGWGVEGVEGVQGREGVLGGRGHVVQRVVKLKRVRATYDGRSTGEGYTEYTARRAGEGPRALGLFPGTKRNSRSTIRMKKIPASSRKLGRAVQTKASLYELTHNRPFRMENSNLYVCIKYSRKNPPIPQNSPFAPP